jgi:plasmid stability protein
MKTTLDLPDELMRMVKLRAVQENRKLKDIVADLLRRGLAQPPTDTAAAGKRVELPLVRTAHRASVEDEMTPDRVAQVLLDEEGRRAAA